MAASVLSACSSAPTIVYPTPPSPASIPQTITITTTNGIGSSAGQVYVAATVRDASGRAVEAVTVRFATTAGTVQPAAVTSDGGGLAKTTVTTSVHATVTVTAGAVASTIDVTPTANVNPGPTPSPPPTPTPSPGPPPQPLTVTILATPGAAGTITTFSLAAPALQQETWTFGDSSAPITTTNHTASHVYSLAGIYTVGVSVIDIQGRTASATLNVTIPTPTGGAPTPTSGLVVTMTCTAAAHGSATVCNLAASYNGTNLQSTPPTFVYVDWDWGDGTSQITTPSPLGSRVYTQAGTYLVVAHVQVQTQTAAGILGTVASTSLTIQ